MLCDPYTYIGYCSLLAFLSQLFELLTHVIPARGSKEYWGLIHHVGPFELRTIKSALPLNSLLAVNQLVAIHHLVLNTLINQRTPDRYVIYACQKLCCYYENLLVGSISEWLYPLPLYWYFHGHLYVYVNHRLFQEKRPILWDVIFFGHCVGE
jgi:hypothetical protein